jgi:hypothetical protein
MVLLLVDDDAVVDEDAASRMKPCPPVAFDGGYSDPRLALSLAAHLHEDPYHEDEEDADDRCR